MVNIHDTGALFESLILYMVPFLVNSLVLYLVIEIAKCIYQINVLTRMRENDGLGGILFGLFATMILIAFVMLIQVMTLMMSLGIFFSMEKD